MTDVLLAVVVFSLLTVGAVLDLVVLPRLWRKR